MKTSSGSLARPGVNEKAGAFSCLILGVSWWRSCSCIDLCFLGGGEGLGGGPWQLREALKYGSGPKEVAIGRSGPVT